MTAFVNSKYSVGYVVDSLLSAAFTVYWGRQALIGLSKVSCVASRGIDVALKACYFDTSRADSWAHWTASFIPARVSNFFKDDSGYNSLVSERKMVPDLKGDGTPKFEADGTTIKTVERDVPVYRHKTVTLLVSGLGLSLIALLALDLKQALWRPASPLLNGILSYISPFQAVLGHSWIAQGINHVVGAVKARV